jgi:hypothetical protein
MAFKVPRLRKIFRVTKDRKGSMEYAARNWKRISGVADAIVAGRPGHESEVFLFDPKLVEPW